MKSGAHYYSKNIISFSFNQNKCSKNKETSINVLGLVYILSQIKILKP